MARRDWDALQAEFTELEKEGINLTQFCESKGLSRSSAGRHIKTAKQLAKKSKKTTFKQFSEEKEAAKESGEAFEERHFTDDKLAFYTEANNVSRKHADFLAAFFRFDSVREAAEHLKIPLTTAYSYLKNESVKRTIDDVTATAFEVEVTTPTRIRGRMCIIANANMKDYFNPVTGEFLTPEKWTRAQGLAVREMKIKPTEFGYEYTLKLYDAMDAQKTLGKVHDLFEKPQTDDQYKDLTDEELEALIEEQESLLSYIPDSPDDEPFSHPEEGREGVDN